jgi:hypothetical protein
VRGGSRCARAPADPRRVCAREGMAGATRNSLETSVPKQCQQWWVPESGHNLEIVETQARKRGQRPCDPAVKERKASFT